MTEKTFYKYRLFTNFGVVFTILSEINTRDKLWETIINSKNDILDVEFFRTNDVNGDLSKLNIRPSVIAAVESPYGDSPVELANDHKQARRDVVRKSPGRIIIEPQAGTKMNNARGLFSKQKRMR